MVIREFPRAQPRFDEKFNFPDFSPPFCPNPSCRFAHKWATPPAAIASPCSTQNTCYFQKIASDFIARIPRRFRFVRYGFARRNDHSIRCRFRCKSCRTGFSSATFDLNYRCRHRAHTNARIFDGLVHNRSNRSIARLLGLGEHTVRNRILRLSRSALLRHYEFLLQINKFGSEGFAYDGVEAFAHSQYEPNNINQVIGRESLFCYLFNFAPLNRKGKISPRQKNYLDKLELKQGRFDTKALRTCTAAMLTELTNRMHPDVGQIHLCSDEHFQYRRALERDLTDKQRQLIVHQTVSSKATRNYKNILFAVNHMDLLLRRYSAAFTRETICFAKKHSRMVHKYILFMVYKNYMRPKFVKLQKNDPTSNTHSPAMSLGLTKKILKFGDFFEHRFPGANTQSLPLDWNLIAQDKVPFERSMKFAKTT